MILTFQHVTCGPVGASNDDSNEDTISWLMGNECKEDEYQAVGMLPECEPTCENRKPVCTKVFYIMDSVQCFCKAPLVRDTKTKKCVQASECPSS